MKRNKLPIAKKLFRTYVVLLGGGFLILLTGTVIYLQRPILIALVNKNWTLKLYFLTYNLYYFTAAYVSLYCLGVKYPREYAGRSSLKNFIYAAISSSIFSPCR